MSILKLLEKDLINTETEAHYSFQSTLKGTTGPHYHDFYEFFLVTEGTIKHIANNKTHIVPEGTLVFIRPADIHYYESHENAFCSFINLAFPAKVIHSLFDYLENSIPKEAFLCASYPPTVSLTKADREILMQKLKSLNLIPLSNTRAKRAELRTLLTELFTRYMILPPDSINVDIPEWLSSLCSEMKKAENFTRGISALRELSGKSHEHLCREIKIYLGITPTEFINDLRLNFAANLLYSTDLPIIRIAFEAGFENLSHFNHRFKNKFKISPSGFKNSKHPLSK
jgi:AraC family cel operon transcriptional repressor